MDSFANLRTSEASTTRIRVPVGAALLELSQGDIVQQDLDAIVNAANAALANGGGVCGAIHRAAGVAELEAACSTIGGCPTGEARLTSGFRLPARSIIHAVGPRYAEHRPAEAARLLASAYRSSLELAEDEGIRSIAFPSLGTGIYGYPLQEAAPIALRTVIEYLQQSSGISHIRFVLLPDSFGAYRDALAQLGVSL